MCKYNKGDFWVIKHPAGGYLAVKLGEMIENENKESGILEFNVDTWVVNRSSYLPFRIDSRKLLIRIETVQSYYEFAEKYPEYQI